MANNRTLSVQLPDDMYAKVKELADRNFTPMASVVKLALFEFFKNHEDKEKKGE